MPDIHITYHAPEPEPPRSVAVQVDVGYACYALVLRDSMVVEAPPIARFMLGWPLDRVIAWANSKGGQLR